jgi:single-strand selective monofunctional uracil DNA glycosylase
MKTADALLTAARNLADRLRPLKFAEPITHVYCPLDYAIAPHEQYLRKFATGPRRVVLLGMNPGPWGMAQTGVPFGEIPSVRDWMGINTAVGKPPREHPKRPIEGFACKRSEGSGKRLWGYFAQRFGAAENFFKEHFVANYCPLVFMVEGGGNFTPDKLPRAEAMTIEQACDEHLRSVVEALQPEWLIGVGAFAEAQALKQQTNFPKLKIGRILHPSPASPAANKDWAGTVERQMQEMGVW